jgi:short-subunit dehydrogenase
MDLAKHEIGVSVLCPGGVQTQILRSERNRPLELGAPQASPEDLRGMAAGETRHPDEMQAPEAIATAVLEGIRANDAYIFTHAHYRNRVAARCAELMHAFDRADARKAQVG